MWFSHNLELVTEVTEATEATEVVSRPAGRTPQPTRAGGQDDGSYTNSLKIVDLAKSISFVHALWDLRLKSGVYTYVCLRVQRIAYCCSSLIPCQVERTTNVGAVGWVAVGVGRGGVGWGAPPSARMASRRKKRT